MECSNDVFGGCSGEIRYCRNFGMAVCEVHHRRACAVPMEIGAGPFSPLWHAQVPEGTKVVVEGEAAHLAAA